MANNLDDVKMAKIRRLKMSNNLDMVPYRVLIFSRIILHQYVTMLWTCSKTSDKKCKFHDSQKMSKNAKSCNLRTKTLKFGNHIC